ncbi:hypothetical protein K505DRAFT_234273 [Melanomma pulvis-pyrius CBS 109.77]|uniref:Uncharacterized protein n=1 Tax=Melanomma pulvis-pyrius CBS 109.77 TaxID=1314802 RepID=A0A6A6XN73_9PLEO|nr:hypothetical protein K505DRAFT_234273 [Melanomma pulvis-pyrius CBS 109.77]
MTQLNSKIITTHFLQDIANDVALEYSLTCNWSTWHIWDYYKCFQSSRISLYPEETPIFQETAPFATCVDLAFAIVVDIRCKLASTPGLEKYVESVQTIACYTGSLPFHCCAAIVLPSECIVIDIGLHYEAFIVPLHSHFDTMPYLNMRGNASFNRFRYMPSSNGAPTLSIQDSPNTGDPLQVMHFAEIGYSSAVDQINFRLARETKDSAAGDHKRVPSAKYLTITSKLLDVRYTTIPSLYIPSIGGSLATTCRLKVDFGQGTITMQIPVVDWLLKSENSSLHTEVLNSGLFYPVSDAVANLKLDLACQREISERIVLVGKIGERIGLPMKEYFRIIASVLDHIPCRKDTSSNLMLALDHSLLAH